MKEVAGLRLHSYFIPCLSGCLSELKSLEMKLNAETQRGPAATQTKSGLTQRHSAAKPQPKVAEQRALG